MKQMIITCMNCGNEYDGAYCPLCGQSATTGRFTWKSLLQAFLHALDFEHGILYVFRELWLRPRQLIFGYLSGKRVNIYPPIKYLLVSIALTAALHYLYKAEDLGMRKVMMDGVEQNFDLWTSTNLSLFHLIVLPFYTLATKVFFREWKLTLPELFVLNMYTLGQSNCLEFILLGVFFWVPGIVGYSTVISVIIPGFIYFMMCKRKTVGSLFKSLTASFLALFLFLITIMVLTLVFMVLTNGAVGLAPPPS